MLFRVIIRKEGLPDETRTVEAPTRFAVYDQVRGEGGVVLSIKERTGFGRMVLSRLNITFGSGIKRQEIIRFARNLSAMIVAGLSISRALSVIERQSSNPRMKAVATGLSESIKKGSSFNEALALYPRVFPEIFVAMARAGEESGSLSESLNVVALQMGRSEELSRKIRGAMIYPSIVIIGVLIVAILMLIFVVPTLTNTFTSLGVQVPLATRIIVAMSDFLVNNAVLIAPVLILLAGVGVSFARSRIGGKLLLLGSLHLPVIGELIRETYTARAARTLSSLLVAGVPVLNALAITKSVVHAEVFANVVSEAEEHVRKGDLLSKAFSEHTGLYPILMSDMLAVGEETGKVAEMLKQIAEFYEDTVSEKTKDLSTIIEPVLMLIIGAFVGVFAVAMIAPIYQLSSAI
ncbi:type II secretion system F family protein [Patescibacteria group bacterium]|nr:type II secretion system F family protein [Patescibacteria group bacterium]